MPLINAVVLVLSTCMLNVVIDTRPQFLSSLQGKALSPKEKTDRPIIDKSSHYLVPFFPVEKRHHDLVQTIH